MSGVFDEKAAAKLEAIYRTPDVVEQRRIMLAALALEPGEAVLDIGTGTGLFLAELGAAVGPRGRAVGIDLSEEMLDFARRKAETSPWIALERGDAAALPFPAASFDAASAVQVYLYVPALETALAELHRVLKPGGRAVVLDSDWDSAVWHSRDRARMARVLAAWEEHFHDAHVASKLGSALRRSGFVLERQQVLPLLNSALVEESYSGGMIRVIRAFVTGRQGIGREEAGAWADELRERGREGSYFFSLNRYLFLARKPG